MREVSRLDNQDQHLNSANPPGEELASHGIEEGKPANFLVLDAETPFEAVRQRADVLASIRNAVY